MSLWSLTKNFYNQHVRKDDRVLILFIGAVFLLGLLYILINTLTFHYTGDFYMPIPWLEAIPLLFALTVLALYAREISPRMAFLTRTYGFYFFITVSLATLTTGIQFTPFPLIDKYLVQMDQLMGFYTIPVLNWTYAHPEIQKILNFCYDGIGYQLFITPILLGLLMDKEAVNMYFLTFLISYLIGPTIYYFFPTAGPTIIFYSPHFLISQHATSLKFYEVHHHLPVTTYDGGMIAFPSFHVFWAVLLTYACKNKKWLFYPLIPVNIVGIAATVLLGWHYLTDVFGGILLAYISIHLARYIYRHYMAEETHKAAIIQRAYESPLTLKAARVI